MARRPRRTPEPAPEALPVLEATQLVDPHAMDRTQVLDPHAMDCTLTGPGPSPALPPERPVLDLPAATRPVLPRKALLTAAAGLVAGLVLWQGAGFLAARSAEATASSAAAAPTGYEQVYARAQSGDVSAMRTLATVYTYGLGTAVDRQEGLRWYHRAAEAGSHVAREELKQIESSVR